jgi:hypothetical protein
MLPLHVVFSAEPVEGQNWSIDNRICLKLCKLTGMEKASRSCLRCMVPLLPLAASLYGCRTAAFCAQDSEQAAVVTTQATGGTATGVPVFFVITCARVSPALQRLCAFTLVF